jgi:hypothetical protein
MSQGRSPKKRAVPLLDYDSVVKTLKAKPGVWFDIAKGDAKKCYRVASTLQKKGCVVHSKTFDGVTFVRALWPDW